MAMIQSWKALLLKDYWILKNNLLLALKKPWRWLVAVGFFGFFIYQRVSISATAAAYPDADEVYALSDDAVQKSVTVFSALAGLGALITVLVVLSRATRKNTTFFINADTHYLFPGPFRPESLLLYQLAKSIMPALFSALIVLLYFFVFLTPESLPFDTGILLSLALPVGLFIFSIRPIQFLVFSHVSGGRSDKTVKHILWVRNMLLLTALVAIAVKVPGSSDWVEVLNSVFVEGSFHFVPFVGWFQAGITALMKGQGVIWPLVLFITTVVALPVGVYALGRNYYEDVLASTELQTRAEQIRSGEAQLTDEIEYSWAINTRNLRDHKEFGKGAVALFWKNWVMSYRQSGIPLVDPTTLVTVGLGILFAILYVLGSIDLEDLPGLSVVSLLMLMFISFSAGWMRVRIGDLARPVFALIPDAIGRKFLYVILLDLIQIGLLTALFYLPLVMVGGINPLLMPAAIAATEVVYLTGFLFQLNVKLRVRNVIDRYIILPLGYFFLFNFCVFPSLLLAFAGRSFFDSLPAGIVCGSLVWMVWAALLYVFAEEEISQLEF